MQLDPSCLAKKCVRSNSSKRRPYSTDVSDCEWVLIEPLLSPLVIKKGAGRPRVVDLREVGGDDRGYDGGKSNLWRQQV